MRILFVNYEYPPLGGGGGAASRALARALVHRGHECAVLTTRFKGQLSEENDDGIKVVRIRAPRRWRHRCRTHEMAAFMAHAWWSGPAIARKFQPDIVVPFFAVPGGPPGLRIARTLRVPCAVFVRGGDVPRPDLPQLRIHHAISKPILKYVWRNADAMVANGQGLARATRNYDPRARVEIIPNGVDIEQFHPPRSNHPRPNNAPIRILTVGRLAPDKGEFHALLRAAAALPEDLPPWEIQVVGDGGARSSLEEEARRLGVAGRTCFLGWKEKEEMPGAYRASDIFVLVSRSEGCPNAALEAQASGLAMIGSRVSGTEDLIDHGRNGLLVEWNDDAGLRDALERLMVDPTMREHLGIEARKESKSRSWGVSAGQCEALFNELIRKKKM